MFEIDGSLVARSTEVKGSPTMNDEATQTSASAETTCSYPGCCCESYRNHSGRCFCVLHLPREDKAADFETAVKAMLEGGDGRFRGVWFPAAADFQGAEFRTGGDFSGAVFNGATDFSYSTFQEPADFAYCRFLGKADFAFATFLSGVTFSFSNFADAVIFRGGNIKWNRHIRPFPIDARSSFGASDILDLAAFETKIESAVDPVSSWLKKLWWPAPVPGWTNQTIHFGASTYTTMLNELIHGPSIYQRDRFKP